MCIVKNVLIGNRVFKVADIKEKYIGNIIEAAKECELIDKIVLFGSSIETRYTTKSDIDLAIFGNKIPSRALESKMYEKFSRKIHGFDYSQDYDLLYFKSDSDDSSPIMQNINHGEVIYERG